ncbi:SsrA-binding protein [Thermobispora bispora]|uniref:SsrA-binding protein n=1 Tax=Thermobispora bispora (strain ATCC 19993 / DSM 43833 / CBS 139.67 / JCM 10125 / KCTC 9307 / NBRC 14880 / R51) TaxID=469371 RepID=D6Y6E7_THEBD|nr:SsrA-binding protein SmpB [Thermobispora bispora]ADG87519.1 SsrA-binding protein [Thermobispora bispora DSM 43833]MBO2472859.1 SsrA-binding protein SmpB [Actinomycetales bacterium]MBX6168391.1 SsrA-binding protein SmpB [Thermobispora bispora]QSI47451.1 SsrA-binding protein SmpB [Thermobispora bispora]
MPRETGRKLIAQNRRAKHDYFIEDTYEAGIVLTGTEVKSLRAGRANLTEGYATVKDGEVWLINVHIPEYSHGTWTNHAPRRTRKLLLHRKEIAKLEAVLKERGLTLVPLSLYFKDGKAKVEIGVARGKKSYDKRQALLEKQAKREMARAMSNALRRRGGR